VAKPTYEDLAELVVQLRAHVAAQDARIAELERQLSATSRNSSKPPSSDGLDKPAPKSLRMPSGRKPGGQPGHEGRTLRQVADPDEVVRHEPAACSGCGASLASAPVAGMTRRQVFDLPPIRVRVCEHQLVSRICACGTVTAGSAPAMVNAPVSYGPRIQAVVTYLFMGQFLSKERTAQAVGELLNIPVSSGSIAALTQRSAEGLEDFRALVAAAIAAAPVAHFDETGFRVAGKLHWLHSASTAQHSLITCHPKRGREGMRDAGVLPIFTGTAVHDAWAPYDTFTGPGHALCNAHLLRELIAVIDYHQAEAKRGSWCWARQVLDALMELKRCVDAGQAPVTEEVMRRQRRYILDAAHLGRTTTQHSPPGKVGAKHRALARRIHSRIDDYLRFAADRDVPFDNNAAEREIRMAKIRQKISGSIRTFSGAEHFAALRSYLATTTKNGIKALDALTQLATGTPWTPETT